MLLPALRQGVHLLQNPAAAARHDSLTERLIKLQKKFRGQQVAIRVNRQPIEIHLNGQQHMCACLISRFNGV